VLVSLFPLGAHLRNLQLAQENPMPRLLPQIDPGGLLEFSAVHTDRALNHMPKRFQGVMTSVSAMFKRVYGAHSAALVPGSGTFGMESVARQFAHGKHVMLIRNGWFKYHWTQIFGLGPIPASHTVLKAWRTTEGPQAPWAPMPIDEVKAAITKEKPALVFAPHVETATGTILPDNYLSEVANAVHAAGGLFVLDCIGSGAMWVEMTATGVVILISAPQKGWSSSPCCAVAMLSERARSAIDSTQSTTFAMDLKKWLQIMATCEGGGQAHLTTLPTDALVRLRDTMNKTEAHSCTGVRNEQVALGRRVRALLERHGFP